MLSYTKCFFCPWSTQMCMVYTAGCTALHADKLFFHSGMAILINIK